MSGGQYVKVLGNFPSATLCPSKLRFRCRRDQHGKWGSLAEPSQHQKDGNLIVAFAPSDSAYQLVLRLHNWRPGKQTRAFNFMKLFNLLAPELFF